MDKLELKDITKYYDGKKVLDKFSLTVERGKPICLFGESGCGKTTVLNIVSGLTSLDNGSITKIEGKRISYLFQEDRLLESATAMENIMLSCKDSLVAEKIVDACDIKAFQNMYPKKMSGGMRRRVAIARAVAFDGDIVLLDEPFNGIDEERTEHIARFLRHYLEDKICIMVSHNTQEAILLNAKIKKVNNI